MVLSTLPGARTGLRIALPPGTGALTVARQERQNLGGHAAQSRRGLACVWHFQSIPALCHSL